MQYIHHIFRFLSYGGWNSYCFTFGKASDFTFLLKCTLGGCRRCLKCLVLATHVEICCGNLDSDPAARRFLTISLFANKLTEIMRERERETSREHWSDWSLLDWVSHTRAWYQLDIYMWLKPMTSRLFWCRQSAPFSAGNCVSVVSLEELPHLACISPLHPWFYSEWWECLPLLSCLLLKISKI